MKNILSFSSLLLLFLLTRFGLSAQIEHGGKPYSFKNQVSVDPVPVVEMPFVDAAALIAEDESESEKGNPPRFGKDLDVVLNLDNSGRWELVNKKDRIWRLHIHSNDAYSLNLIFDQFYIPEGGKLFLYTPDRSYVLGSFTHENNKSHGMFSTTVLPGPDMILEYYEPWTIRGQSVIEIGKVIHGYKNAFYGKLKGFGDSGSCNNNVNCPVGIGWENEINASLMYLLSNNTRICSGAMVNNTALDRTPYFLSANHCYSASWATWIFMFNYQSPNCTNIDGPTNQTVSGSILRSRRTDTDFMLFELSSQPPANYNVYLSGWDKTNIPATSAVCVHHPANDIKKISFENDPLDSTAWGGGADDHWEVFDWDDGTTEPGSSGSPLFNQNHHIVGQLHGGGAACGNNLSDQYGRFDLSWDGSSASARLKDWLDPGNTGVDTLGGMYQSTPTLALDVAGSFISGIEEMSCNTDIEPSFQFRNNGSSPITSVTIEHGIVGQTLTTLPWSGNLDFPGSDVVNLPLQTLAAGSYEHIVILSNPNGGTDQDNSNDTLRFPFDIINGQTVTIELLTDDYPEESGIEIREQISNNLVYSLDVFDANTLYNLEYCLDTGCYIFRITDTYGDGICCGYGNGYYEFYLPNGTLAATGGQFAFSEATQFCVEDTTGQTSLSSLISNPVLRVYPNPAQDQFIVEFIGNNGESVSLQALNALGQEVANWNLSGTRSTFRIEDWPAGVYHLRATSGTQTSHFKLVVR